MFTFEKYGIKRKFKKGQAVECTYYHEYDGKQTAYKRNWFSKLIDRPFTPVKYGIIVGDAGVHPYWMGENDKEQYLLVKFREYKLPKPIPVSCIKDAIESAFEVFAYLEKHKDKIKDESIDSTSYASYAQNAVDALGFISENKFLKFKIKRICA